MHLGGALRQLAYTRSRRGVPTRFFGDIQLVASEVINADPGDQSILVTWPDGSKTYWDQTSWGQSHWPAQGTPAYLLPQVQQQYASWASIFNASTAASTLTSSTLTYPPLPSANVAAFGVPSFGASVLQPHTTDALNWFTNTPVLNIGAPTALNDPYEYLRSALIDSDWQRIAYFYAYYISYIWNNIGKSHSSFFGLSQLNLAAYKYVVNSDGTKTYFPFSNSDLNNYFRNIEPKFLVIDTGRATAVFGWVTPKGIPLSPLNDDSIYQSVWGRSYSGGPALDSINGVVKGYPADQNLTAGWQNRRAPYTALSLGWQQGPAGNWDFNSVMGVILQSVVAAGFAYGIATAISTAAAAASTSVPTAGTAVPAATAVTETAAAPAVIAAPISSAAADATIETVVVSQSALTGAGIGAGTASVAAGAAAGTIVAVASLAPISPATTANPPPPDTGSVAPIETVTTTEALLPAGTVATTAPAIVGATIAATSQAALDIIAANQSVPQLNTDSNVLPKSVQDSLKSLATSKGAAYALSQLGALLGHTPTADEIAAANALLGGHTSGTDLLPWIMIAGLGAVMIFSVPKKKK